MNSSTTTRLATTILAVSLNLGGCGGGNAASVATVTTPAEQNPPSTVQPAAKVPEIPTGVSVLAGTNKLTLSWNSASGATSYGIYWSTTPGVTTASGTRIATAGTNYIHRGLPPAVVYYYVVTAQNGSGESAASAQFSGTTATADGSLAYASYCANCHGALAVSTVTNAGVPQIKSALQSIGAMSGVAPSDAQIDLIAAALLYNN